MRSTLANLKSLKFKDINFPWVVRGVNEYIEYLRQHHPGLARKLEKTPYAGLNGSPHPTPSKNDPLHASVALRKKENLKGSGLSLHVYPNGTVVPSKEEFPVATMTAATAEELGAEHAQWLDPDFVAQWQAANDAKYREKSIARKGESEGKGESSRGSSSKKHGGSADHSSSSGKGKGKASGSNEYSLDESTGTMYRYLENGAVVYYDPNSKREYYYDEHGQAVWL